MRVLDRIVANVGTKTELARRLGISYQAVVKWQRENKIPVERVLQIVELMNGEITPLEIRPDIYPDPDWMPKSVTQNRA